MPQSRADTPPWRGTEKRKERITQRRREKHEKDFLLACRGMGILPMILTGGMPVPPEQGLFFVP